MTIRDIASQPGDYPNRFGHKPVEAAGHTALTSTTRYLCGAAYVDEHYANELIQELVEDAHRAVVPALGFDLDPVLRHCFRARRLWLTRNLLVTAVLVTGVILTPSGLVALVVIAALLALVVKGLTKRSSKRQAWKIILFALAAVTVAGCVVPPILTLWQVRRFTGSLAPDGSSFRPAGQHVGWGFLAGTIVLGLVILLVLSVTQHAVIKTIATDLRPGQIQRAPTVTNPRARQRLEHIRSAQQGNIVLHSGYDPFLGAGEVTRAWSIALELRPSPNSDHAPTGGATAPGDVAGSGAHTARTVHVDPVDLVRHTRFRLAQLRSQDLPENERITGLTLRDQIMASGARWGDFPLVNASNQVPYSYAPAATTHAIIACPQTSARHFLRATVGAQEKPARTEQGTPVMPGENQSAVTSTFIHIAVEGGMLYVESVAAVLGPLRQRYLDIDRYSSGADELPFIVAGEALREWPTTVVLAPFSLVQYGWQRIAEAYRSHRADRESATEATYDFGARAEARQLASYRGSTTYVQRLDAEKYTKLIERRTSEAIIEYLRDHGIDTAEYSAQVTVIQHNTTLIGGSNYGPVATGSSASASANTAASAASAMDGDRKGKAS